MNGPLYRPSLSLGFFLLPVEQLHFSHQLFVDADLLLLELRVFPLASAFAHAAGLDCSLA